MYKEKRYFLESSRLGATIAGATAHPQNITSCINLHMEFSWRRTQEHCRKIKPVTEERMNQILIKIRNIINQNTKINTRNDYRETQRTAGKAK